MLEEIADLINYCDGLRTGFDFAMIKVLYPKQDSSKPMLSFNIPLEDEMSVLPRLD